MTAEAILADLLASGITPAVTPDGAGIVVPAGRLSPAQRAAILGHKSELIACVLDSARITSELLDAAMRACDQWGDSEEARDQMRRDILQSPYPLRHDLLQHFKAHYREYPCLRPARTL